MRSLILAALFLLPAVRVVAQNIGINANGAAPNTSAILDIDVSAIPGAKRGLLIPRVTTVERNAIPTPATSLLIFNTTTQQFEYFDGLVWKGLTGWSLAGNTIAGTEFLGTITNQPLLFRVNNQTAGRLEFTNLNTFFGSNTGAGNTGQFNTFIGGQAGQFNTSGSANTYLGAAAGQAASTGAQNTAIGYTSSVSTGLSNATAIGAYAQATQPNSLVLGSIVGVNAAPASTNVGIGTTAPTERLDVVGKARVTNFQMTTGAGAGMIMIADAVGNGSWANPTGSAVNAWGVTGNAGTNPLTNYIGTSDNASLRFRTNNILAGFLDHGSSSAFYGTNAGGVTNSGTFNTFLGASAGNANGIGAGNTFVGAGSGASNVTGVENTAIGFSANVNNGLSNATAVGNRALATQSNSVVLGSINGVNGSFVSANVGIGTTAPAQRLHVVGNIRMEDGNQALGKVLTSDANGTATWQTPGGTNDWGLLGNAATNPATNFIGTTDLQPLKLRVGNVFAGQLTPSLTGLVSYGLAAGAVNTGTSNTFLGNNAGAANVASSNNTYVGANAGAANVNGAQNVFIGRLAGGSGATGSDNILIGNGAGIANTANNNVMIGSFAGNGNSTGGGNTFMGAQAGSATTTGGQNTFIGTSAGSTNTIGAQNTLLGNGASVNANNLTNATAIGRASRVDVNDGLVLGSVSGINAATSTSLVGIGTTAPLDRLHVVGNIRMVDGNQAVGKVLTSDANGTATWQTAAAGGTTLDGAYDFGGAGIGRTIAADAGAVTIAGTDGFLTTGTLGSGANPEVVGAGTRMFFNPRKAAFRAGEVNGAQWNTANVGNHSVAMGLNVTASGIGSVALGEAVAATALGSAAIGFSNTASGIDSKAIGSDLIASGPASIALGNDVTTSGTRSSGLGDGLLVRSRSEVVLGLNNTDYVPISTAVFNAADRLFVVGNGTTTATRSDALVILKNGNTGIGTSTPAQRLHVSGTAGTPNVRLGSLAGVGVRLVTADANGDLSAAAGLGGVAWVPGGNSFATEQTLGTNNAFELPLEINGVERMRLKTTGALWPSMPVLTNTALGDNTGAALTASAARVTAIGASAGAANTDGDDNTYVGANAGAAMTTSFFSTYVGSGAGRFAAASNNALFGYQAGGLGLMTGGLNTFLGSESGQDNTTGNGNTFVGFSAGSSTTTGSQNVFIGREAGSACLTFSASVFVGSFAGNATTVAANTFVGGNAGRLNTTGTNNAFLGDQTGSSNLVGSDNTFLGHNSGTANTASDNTFVGSRSGDSNTTGAQNTYMGTNAGTANVAGNDGTFIGFGSGLVTTGSGSTFIGSGAGNVNTTGTDNTFIGQDAGNTNSVGDNNVVLGNNADVGSNNLQNAIAIGADAIVGASNSMVLGATGLSAVNVGIGTTTPLTTVDMLGALSIRDDGTTTSIAADNQLVTVGNRGYIRLTSTNNLATARTITLSDGLVRGQLLILQNSLGVNFFEVDDNAATNNTVAPVARVLGVNDSIMLLWNGTDWTELSYSDN